MVRFCKISSSEFDAFAIKHPESNIHQTSMWADFQSNVATRGKAVIYGIKDGDNLCAAAVFVRQKLPMGLCWYFVPRGPLLGGFEYFKPLMDGFIEIVQEEKCVFVRVEPPYASCPFLNEWGREAHAHYFPEDTILINLEQSEEEILEQMKPKGRYNIKVAEKHGVKIRTSRDVDEFFKIFVETTGRDGFRGHDRQYYQSMLDFLGDSAVLYLAELDDKAIAGIIATFYHGTAIYYFGASSSSHREAMAPYLLQWRAILDAKQRGCKVYDLFGVAPKGDNNHPWAGITKFKEKFGGELQHYARSREKVLKPFWYWLMMVRKKCRV